jgi:acetyl esterase/lipase
MELPKIRHIPSNPSLEGMAEHLQNIVYSTETGADITLSLMIPWGARERKDHLPLIVFVQGSAWTFPDLGYETPQMADYARNGYVVAMATHRNCLNGHPFPAYLEDVKAAIRFLKRHAEEYAIDKNRVCVWGTSSGGNTALLVGLTADDPAYKTAECAEVSDKVNLVVECFGPTDLPRMLGGRMSEEPEIADIFKSLIGGRDARAVLSEMSPVSHVKPDVKYPPFLLIHGDADELVPYDQMTVMLSALSGQGADVQAVCVDGAPHEGSFWSRELHGLIQDYIREKL